MTNPAPEPATAETALTTTGPTQIVAPELVHAALAFTYCVAAARGATPSGAVAVFVDEAGRVLDTATAGDGATGSATDTDPERIDTMTVTVRHHAREAPWGSATRAVTTVITISAYCTIGGCGQRRGAPYGRNSCDDGAWYWVEQWDNPCGHVDFYDQVIGEAHNRLVTRAGGLWVLAAPPAPATATDGGGGVMIRQFIDVHMVGVIATTRAGRHPEFAEVVSQSDTTVRLRVRDGGGVAVFGWRPHDANDTDTATAGDVGSATPTATDSATTPVPAATEVTVTSALPDSVRATLHRYR